MRTTFGTPGTSQGSLSWRWLGRASSCSAALLACAPEAEERQSLVDSNRVLAIVAEPAEVEPGAVSEVSVLVAGPSGTIVEPEAYYSLCLVPKPPAENNAVSSECWDEQYVPVGGPGAKLDIVVPEDACARFGPETPPGGGFRPRDADETGGYYQPIRVAIPELAAFGFIRIRCALPNAPADIALDFGKSYQLNRNPVVESFAVEPHGDEAGASVAAGKKAKVRVAWTGASAERYVLYDREKLGLVEAREAIRVSWFATAGTFSCDVTGRGESEPESYSEVTWEAPDEVGTVQIWVVARDSRGGSAFAETLIEVR